MTISAQNSASGFHAASLIDQSVHIVSSFTLESGNTLREVPIAYKTWGTLNETRDNVLIICHALTGSADVEDWWGPLIGRGKAFDPSKFFLFCANVMGSPYGSASPVTINPDTGKFYGPDFPRTTIRDDVRIHKLVLDHLGVTSVQVVVGGSMGGMAVLEWPLCSPPGYIKHIVPLATSARHSAWCISWGEAQRQSIFSDPAWDGGRYIWATDNEGNSDAQPRQPMQGLAAARMTALLTYRSRDSFESRFGRKPQAIPLAQKTATKPPSQNGAQDTASSPSSDSSQSPVTFSAQGYLRYQGAKFTSRFDANCYIHLTYKMDSHDLARGRVSELLAGNNLDEDDNTALATILARLPPRTLVIGIASDGLFTTTEQALLAEHIPDATLVVVLSPDGHDGFLLEFKAINRHILAFLHRECGQFYQGEKLGLLDTEVGETDVDEFAVKKESLFGEAEVDVTRW